MAQGLSIDFTGNLARFTSAVDKATNDLNKFQTNAQRMAANVRGSFQALAGVLSVSVMAGWVKSGIDAADAMNDLSERTGLAVETLAGLEFAAKLSDTSLQSVSEGVNKLTLYMGDADRGNKKYQETLTALGITARDPEQALIQLADVFPRLTDQNQRASVMNDILGKSWQELVPLLNQGGDGLRRLIEQGREFNPLTKAQAEQAAKLNDQLDTLKARADGAAVRIGTALVPSMNDMLTRFNQAIDLSRQYPGGFVNLILHGINPTGDTGRELKNVTEDIAEMEAKVAKLREGGASDYFIRGAEEKLAALKAMKKTLQQYQAEEALALGAPYADYKERKTTTNKDGSFTLPTTTVKGKAPTYADIFSGEEYTKAQRALAAAGKLTGFSYITADQAFAKQVRESQDFINQMNAAFATDQKSKAEADHDWLLEEQRHYLDTYNETMQEHYERLANLDSAAIAKMDQTESERAARLATIQAELAAGIKTQTEARSAGLQVNRQALAAMEAQYEVLLKLAAGGYKGAAEAAAKYESVLIGLRDAATDKGWQQGVKDGLKDYAGQFNDTYAQIRDATKQAFQGMEDSLVQFVKTGKVDFKSLADSIISNLIRIQIQNSITKPLADLVGGFNIGKLFGFADGGVMTSTGPLPLRAYATGGVANSPQLALFGEGRMPEAFVPLPDGRSIPVTMKGGQAAGQPSVVVNQTIHVDSRADQAVVIAAMRRAKDEAVAAINQSLARGGRTARLAGVV